MYLRTVAMDATYVAMEAAYARIMTECYSRPVDGPEALGPAAGTFRTVLEDDAAVAAATVGTIAVVGPEGEQISVMITNSEIRNYVTQQLHQTSNETLIYLRDHVGEKEVRGEPSRRAIELTTAHLGGGLTIPTMTTGFHKNPEAIDYTFHHELPPHIVDCKAVIANLPRKERDKMLGANHVCRMTLEWVPKSFDRKRRDMAQNSSRWLAFPTNVPIYVWEYHILLSDGSVWRFHTESRTKAVSITKVEPCDSLLLHPQGSYYDPTRNSNENSAVAEAESAVAAAGSAVAVANAAVESAFQTGAPTDSDPQMTKRRSQRRSRPTTNTPVVLPDYSNWPDCFEFPRARSSAYSVGIDAGNGQIQVLGGAHLLMMRQQLQHSTDRNRN